jgi:hypothetical protein
VHGLCSWPLTARRDRIVYRPGRSRSREGAGETALPSPWQTNSRESSGPSRREACPSIRSRSHHRTFQPETHKRRNSSEFSRPRTRKMRQMSSVRPTRGQADNLAGPKRPLFNDWLPVCGFHPGPEPTLAPTKEAVDTCAVATPSAHHYRDRSDAASTSTTENFCFLRRRKPETAGT